MNRDKTENLTQMTRLEFLQPYCTDRPRNRFMIDTGDKLQVAQQACSLLRCAETGMQLALAEDTILMQAEIRQLFFDQIKSQLEVRVNSAVMNIRSGINTVPLHRCWGRVCRTN